MRSGRLLRYTGSALSAIVLLAAAPSAHGGTRYVANNGVDGAACGTKTNPCRSITLAVAFAAPGDTIIVGPGRYGDLDRDGALGETGEEFGIADCPPLTLCPAIALVRVNKPVTVVSSHGAASTLIDARSVDDIDQNVLLNGGEFGRPGKGFTVTNTANDLANGIVVDGADVKVRGNQIVGTLDPFATELLRPDVGIKASLAGAVLIEGNQVMGTWQYGIFAHGTGKLVRKNQVSTLGFYGIYAGGSSIVLANVVTGDARGIGLDGGAQVVGNNVSVNAGGIWVHASSPFSGVVERNNIVGNGDGNCGLYNNDVPGLSAPNNYWGAASGPGSDPADKICNLDAGTTTATPFATKPFSVSAPIKP